MAAKLSEALSVVTNVASKLFKPPWKLSGGPVADAAYKSHLPRADKYRTILPTDVKDIGFYNPLADPRAPELFGASRMFNTRYYVRDKRRKMNKVVGGVTKYECWPAKVEVEAVVEAAK